MNAQEKIKDGKVIGRGIQWTDWTWNPIAGCKHACRWEMPDGSIAICYAEEVARKFTAGYPQGFEHHYWRPANLAEPSKLKTPAKIFMDSMADAMGAWVPEAETQTVLDTCRAAGWHTFQLLTKNAPRLLRFEFPANVWVGASSPPDFMLGKRLDRNQQERMLRRILETLTQVKAPVRWMSVEPLSWDVAQIMAEYPQALQWAVIGAATNGPKVYQPDPAHVARLLDVFDRHNVPVFFKGNLFSNAAANPWREYFPGYVPSPYMGRELGPHAVPVNDRLLQAPAIELEPVGQISLF